MHFEWSWALPGLALVPVLAAVYLLTLRRKRRFPVRYASLMLIREARPSRGRWRRHLPFVLFLASIAVLLLAFARPERTVTVERGRTTILLALDVSRSMCATDVLPNRLVVAQDAAQRFVDDQPEGTRLGIVAFAGSAQLVVPPTTDKDRLRDAIDGLTTAFRTGIGNAILVSIDALADVNPAIAPSTVDLSGAEPGAPGEYQPDIIVLLTDGANTRGVEPVEAAQQAADRRVRVYTIGFGTTDPVALVCTPEQLGGDALDPDVVGPPGFGGPGGGGLPSTGTQFLLIDEPTLEAVAQTSGGEYYRAENAGQLIEVFRELPRRVELQEEDRELSVWFALAGAVLVLAAVGLSLRWNRVP